jgi:hypothetical protein
MLPEPFRPLPIRAFNGVGRALARGGIHPFRFDHETVMRMASKATGLDDYGDESFLPGLRKLTQSLEEDAQLNLFGRYFARRQLLELLGHRLRILDHRRRHPELAEEEITKPLFIVGLPRTGTTLLQGLLSTDPANRTALSWESDDPCPPARTESYETDPRIAYTEKRFEQLRQLAPTFQAIHPIGATMPQECIVLTAPEFMSLRFEMCFDVPGYQDWMVEQDMTSSYRFHRLFLQHMQSGHRAERWVLKSPGHLGPFEALFAVYPDARIIQTHRDPIRIVPSVASLEYSMRQIATDDLDPHEQGRQALTLWSKMLEQAMQYRAGHPERESQFIDLHMREIVSDPIDCIGRAYDRFGFELSDEAKHRMREYIATHPKDEHGEHRYSLEAFGLREDEIRAAFKGYCEHFDVAPEPYEAG